MKLAWRTFRPGKIIKLNCPQRFRRHFPLLSDTFGNGQNSYRNRSVDREHGMEFDHIDNLRFNVRVFCFQSSMNKWIERRLFITIKMKMCSSSTFDAVLFFISSFIIAMKSLEERKKKEKTV